MPNGLEAANQLAKTDAVDAATLAWFGEAMKPPLRGFASAAQAELQDLVTRRRPLVARLTAEPNRLSGLRGKAQGDGAAHLEWLRARMKQLGEQIEPQSHQCQLWNAKQAQLQSVPGVGTVVAATFLTLLPALGQLSSQKIGTLVGVAPLNRDRGQMQGQRTIFGGRSAVRQMLYMATLVAVRHNPIIRAFHAQ